MPAASSIYFSPLSTSLSTLAPQLSWQSGPSANTKVSTIATTDSANVSLLLLEKGTQLDQTFEDADMTLLVVSGGEGAEIGPTESRLEGIKDGQILFFLSTQPKVIKV